MTYEYNTLIGDGRAVVSVQYEINGDLDDFDIEIMEVLLGKVDVIDCLLTQQIVELEMHIIKRHKNALSGMADI